MSELDEEMSKLLGKWGFDERVQLRTKYFDDVVKMKDQNIPDDEIDKLLKIKEILVQQSGSKKRQRKTMKIDYKYLLLKIVSGWVIWCLTIYTLEKLNVIKIYSGDWWAWLILPPVIILSLWFWLRVFFKK